MSRPKQRDCFSQQPEDIVALKPCQGFSRDRVLSENLKSGFTLRIPARFASPEAVQSCETLVGQRMLAFDRRAVSTQNTQHQTKKGLKTREAVVLSYARPDSPLTWWRTREPCTFSRPGIESKRLQALIRRRSILDPDWPNAVKGDASAAIAVAIRQLKKHVICAEEIDLALSAVLTCALKGDVTSPIVLSSALRRRTRVVPECSHLVESWLKVRFAKSVRASGY
jgi:hypothetical protein